MRRMMIAATLVALISLLQCPICGAQDNDKLAAQTKKTVKLIEKYGTFDTYCTRQVKESAAIGGKTKTLYEFYGNFENLETREPLAKPAYYLWRTNNVLAHVCGIYKTNTTVFPEKRGEGYCARIETHIEEVTAVGIIEMKVVCQGALLIGDLLEPIKDTKSPMSKVMYGLPFAGRPKALVFDYKADVGHTTVRATGLSPMKTLDYPDYPEVCIVLQKRWEDEKGKVHAKRVGTGIWHIEQNAPEWVNGYRLNVEYGDITSKPFFKDYMGLRTENRFHTINSKGNNVEVLEEAWASPGEEPNYMIIYFIASSGQAFYGGVGNTIWIDNVKLDM